MAGFETLLPARLTEVVPTWVMPDFMGIKNYTHHDIDCTPEPDSSHQAQLM